MDERARSAGFGKVCMNAALVLTASWVPALGLLDGASWASPKLAGAAHFFGLAFMLGAPLAFGLRLALRTAGDARAEALRDWAVRCLLPPVLFASAVQGVILMVPHVTTGVIVLLMFAGIPLGVYGLLLVKDATAVES